MHGAGKRVTQPPVRYDPSHKYPFPLLPVADFDLTMSTTGEPDLSLTTDSPLTLAGLEKKLNDITHTFSAQLDNVHRKVTEVDNRIDVLCSRIDDIDIENCTKISQLQSDFHKDIIETRTDLSYQQQRSQESQKQTVVTHRALQDTIKALSDRLSLVEGQASRLAALENKVHNVSNISFPSVTTSKPQPTPQNLFNNVPPVSQNSFNDLLTSTTISSSHSTHCSAPPYTSNISVPSFSNTFPNSIMPPNNNTIISNISGINFDTTKLSTFNGNLTPVHPEDFLEQAEQYFLTQPPVPDQVKINYIKSKFVDDARLWYHTLLPPPSVYKDFLMLFRNHFWSSNQQRSVRNELYRPHYHRDNSTLQKHAMDWINKARFLRPPIDQVEMVDQIISHYAFHVSVALRGLRITTTNELIQQLSHLQQAHSPHSTQNSQSQVPTQQQNSNYNSSNPYNNNRYPPRQNNYHSRSQQNNNNQSVQSSQPSNTAAPSGN